MSRQDQNLTISNDDLTAAVKAGVLDEAAATRLADFIAGSAAPIQTDEEQFRLLTGFNDIFVAIGLGLFFGALLFMLGQMAFMVMAVSAWVLAEIFTRRMRMALPSIILLLVFIGSVGLSVVFWGAPEGGFGQSLAHTQGAGIFLIAAVAAVLGAALHWWRFHVPITIAAGCGACILMVIAALKSNDAGFLHDNIAYAIFVMGFAVFCLAMYFDRQDRARRTQLADRAFWLHLLAAPLIVHPLVANMVSLDAMPLMAAVLLVALFIVFGLIALIVDRRALLVSSLIYLFYALYTIIGGKAHGVDDSGIAILSVGVIVLLLSVAWRPLRAALLPKLPLAIQNQVPYLQS